jgi:hypothetical protein
LKRRRAGEQQKKAPREYGLDRGASIGALWQGESARYHSLVGAVALGGNHRNLLTRWCGKTR